MTGSPPESPEGRGVLYVVATPIGNLEDITIRALSVLKSADLVACEDTRKSLVLMRRWNISPRLLSLHRFSERKRIQAIILRLERGEQVALITDAGTPAISDPGHLLVRAVRDAGFTVTPIPGASSIAAALSVSGMDASSFVYLGFAPRRDDQRAAFFRDLVSEARTALFFETPRRILDTLAAALEILPERRMVVLRELTKRYEEALSGTAASILETFHQRDTVRGEIVVVVQGASRATPDIDPDQVVRLLMEEGLSGKRLADEAATRFGLKKGEAYRTFLRIKGLETRG